MYLNKLENDLSDLRNMRVALVYDRVNKWGGAERVLLSLHELFPDAPLYTSVYSSEKARWAKKFSIKTSFLQKLPFARSSHEYFALLMPLAFESFSFDAYDLVISVTSESAKGIITKPGTKHICYCLTPTRYLWSGYDEYFSSDSLRFFSQPAISYLRAWDMIAGMRPDVMIAISKEVKVRIRRYYGRDSAVIYPPVTLPQSSIFSKVRPLSRSDLSEQMDKQKTGFFLIVSRLVPYKRVDLAIDACNRLKVSLKIVGVGSDEGRLKKMSGPTIEFLGSLTDDEVVGYYKDCRALIFPGVEDFGIAILESQGFGKPVIAFKGGGAVETVIEGKTGTLFSPQTAEALLKKMRDIDILQVNPRDCIVQAERFSKDAFRARFNSVVREVMSTDLTLPSPKRRGIKGI